MDIVSHGLWAGAAAEAINKKKTKPLKFGLAFFSGIFPDLFAFTPVFFWYFWALAFNQVDLSNIPKPSDAEPSPTNTYPIFHLTSTLYSFSHSLFIFACVFTALWFIFKKPIWETTGWLLHVIMDIPTHSYKFYPTPFLWPFSTFKFDGIPWDSFWFMILDYSLIILVYILLRKRKQKIKGASLDSPPKSS